MVSLPPVTEIPTTLRPTPIVAGDPNPPNVPTFILPLVIRDYPYGMPTAMVIGLQSHASMFADNAATIALSHNAHLVLGYATGNPGQMAQPQGGV